MLPNIGHPGGPGGSRWLPDFDLRLISKKSRAGNKKMRK